MKEISLNDLRKLAEGSYRLIDVRDEALASYGMLPGAVRIDMEELEKEDSAVVADIPQDKKLIIYCQIGKKTKEAGDLPALNGREYYGLEGGYMGYLQDELAHMEEGGEKQKKAEMSIRKKYHKQLYSMLMAKLFQEIQTHRQVKFDVTFLVMDPGYNKENRQLIESNAKALGIPITIFESNIFDSVDNIEKSPCYICARMRRGFLYSKAKELGCNKIALGHHYDDVIETILMGMLQGGQIQTMMPKLHSTNFEGMELIRPMYFIRESDICAWRDYNELHFLQCACHFTETCSTCHTDGTTSSKRLETKKLIERLKKDNPFVESNIFRSVENVQLNTIIEYKKDGVRHNFLDEY